MAKWKLLVVCVLISRVTSQDAGSNLVYPAPSRDTLHTLFKLLEKCGLEEQKGLRRFYLSGNATCNDGSHAGYYIRKSHGSKRWILYLEGGWYCYDNRSCHNRWLKMRHLMSSKQWPEFRNVGGILSPNPEENPYWWNANHVFVPYCSSDSWSGSKRVPPGEGRFSFLGSLIVEQVVQDLLQVGLTNASSLLFAGSSAGGAGVMLNLERVQSMLRPYRGLVVRGISDSGWFLDRAPYSSQGGSLPSIDAVKRGLPFWQGRIPANCRAAHPHQPWTCYFGYKLYPTISAPLFIFQWLFDEAQMTADNVGAPVTKQQWDYIHKMGDSLRSTFKNVTSVFAPSCISHSVLTKKDWQVLRIDEVSLPQALRCWELSTHPSRHNNHNRISDMLADAPYSRKISNNLINPQKKRMKMRRRKGGRNKKRGRKMQNGNERPEQKRRNGGLRRGMKRAQRQAGHACRQRLIERCSWPQCNKSCPRLHNPFTGEEMDFIELLKSFGLDMRSVANALGMDINTLNNMDHEELLSLLTQRAN